MIKIEKAIKNIRNRKARLGINPNEIDATWAAFTIEMIKDYFGEDSYIFDHSKKI